MPLERPRRRPVIQPNGENDPKWLQYFDEVDDSSSSVESFESESRFLAGESSALPGQIRQLKAKQRETLHLPVPAVDRRVGRLQAVVREMKFLEL